MSILRIVFMVIVCNGFGQERRINSTMTVVEEFTVDSYSCPDTIVFYAEQEERFCNEFQAFFERIERKFNNVGVSVDTFFDPRMKGSKSIKTFEDLEYPKSNVKSRYVCVFGLSNYMKTANGVHKARHLVINTSSLYWVYDLYVMLVDTKTEQVMLKRKFNIKGEELLDKGRNKLVKIIGRELNII